MREEGKASQKYKELYLNGLEKLIENKEAEYAKKREEYIKDIFSNAEKYREDFKKMLGEPLVGYEKNGLPNVKSEKIGEENGHEIFRVSFEILDDLWMTGLLFKKDDEKRPMVITQHGGGGTPELISDFYGEETNYNHILERVIQYDVNAFAPQLILWNKESWEPTYNRQELDARLKRVGSSITAVEVFGITRIIDWFEAQSYVKNFGMVGLSYGGFYTLFTTAVDKRIKAAISCSYFNDRAKIGWSDWTWNDAAEKFYDAEVACLIYPRKLCIEVGKIDELFNFEYAQKEFDRLKAMTEKVGDDWLDFVAFEGNHEFCKDDMPIKKLAEALISETL